MNAYALIIAGILIVLILGYGLYLWVNSSPNVSCETDPLTNDLNTVRDVLISDAHYNRLVMIEIINKSDPGLTINQMTAEAEIFRRALIRSFGGTTAARLAELLRRRNQILVDYYRQYIVKTPPPDLLSLTEAVPCNDIPSPSPDLRDHRRQLHLLSRELVTNLEGPESEQSESLHNLFELYDQALLNQAKTYAAGKYQISMAGANSCVQIAQHIATHLAVVMRHTFRTMQPTI